MEDDVKPMTILDVESGLLYVFCQAPLFAGSVARRGHSPGDCDRPNEACWIVKMESDQAVEEAMALTRIAAQEINEEN